MDNELESLRRKYNDLLKKSVDMAEELRVVKKQRVILKKQRNYLLDRLLEQGEVKKVKKGRGKKSEEKKCVAELSNGRDKCKLKALKGSDYCRHHAAYDTNSAYHFCRHVDTSGKQCTISILKADSSNYCGYHKKKHNQSMQMDHAEMSNPPVMAQPVMNQ